MAQLLRIKSVVALTGLAKSEIYRRMARGEFVAPIRLGKRAIAFDASEINQWIAAQIVERPRVMYRKPAQRPPP